MDNCLHITSRLVDDFLRWASREGAGSKTLRDYRRYVSRLVGVSLCGKNSVDKAFEAMGGLNKSSYEAFRRLLTFMEKRLEGYDRLAAELRKALPRKPRSREDTYIPPDTRIREAYRCLEARFGKPYTLFYLVLLYSGVRGTEARYILENAARLRTVRLGYAVRVHLEPEMQRRSKRAYVAYMPEELWREILAYNGRLPHQDTLEDRLRECGVPVKYLRKWWRQKAKLIGIDSETIEAFQGRPSTIGGRHYTDWIPILDKEYKKIVETVSVSLYG